MYIIKSDKRVAFKTYTGWTQLVKDKHGERIDGMSDVARFTNGEAKANKDKLPAGWRFVWFPKIEWSDFK